MINNKNIFSALLCMNIVGYMSIIAASKADENLNHDLPAIMIEEEIRLLEKDLNGDPYKGESILMQWDDEEKKYVPWIPESDIIAIQALARYRLNAIPQHEFYSKNIPLIRTEENRAIGDRVAEMASYHVAKRTNNNQRMMAQAGKMESQELMDFLSKHPLRKGRVIKHYFGKSFEKRVAVNIMNGKYGY